MIRPARPSDTERLRRIERRAGEAFRAVGLDAVAEDPPPPAAVLDRYAAEGRSWVVVDATDRAVGYVLVDLVDGCAHIEQVTVDPDHQGRGIGGDLVAHVGSWARDAGLSAITLTTFRDVAWNAPWYRRLGFRALDDDELGAALRALRDEETAHGLDPGRRVCMRLDLTR